MKTAEVTVTPVAAGPPAPAAWVDRMTPRVPTVASDWAVPALLGITIGALGAVPFAAVTALLGASWYALAVWAGVACALAVLVVIWRVRQNDATLYAREVAQGRDLNGDGQVGKPAPAPEPLRYVWVQHAQGMRPMHPEDAEMREFLTGCYGSVGTAAAAWVGRRFLCTGRTVTRGDWEGLTEKLMRAGLLLPRGKGKRPTLRGDLADALAAFDFAGEE